MQSARVPSIRAYRTSGLGASSFAHYHHRCAKQRIHFNGHLSTDSSTPEDKRHYVLLLCIVVGDKHQWKKLQRRAGPALARLNNGSILGRNRATAALYEKLTTNPEQNIVIINTCHPSTNPPLFRQGNGMVRCGAVWSFWNCFATGGGTNQMQPQAHEMDFTIHWQMHRSARVARGMPCHCAQQY